MTPDQLAPITADHRAAMELQAARDIARAEAKQLRQQIEDDSLVYGLLHDERDAIARERDDLKAQIDRAREYVGGDLTLTNAEMADLAELDHDTHHDDCAQVWQRYYVRVVRAALDGNPS